MRSLTTFCRAAGESPTAFAARADALGARGIVCDRTASPAFRAELPERVELTALEPAAPAPPRRAPRLASDDKEERRAAQALIEDALTLADDRRARVVIVRLGAFEPGNAFRAHVERTLRREQRPRLGDLERERVKMTAHALDLARWGLEPVLERADARGVTIAVANVARWFELPTVAELGVLIAELAGAPLRPWLDPAAAHARAALGFDTEGWLDALAPTAVGCFLADACVLTGTLPWGTGEVDHAAIEAAIPKDALIAVHASPGATNEELERALQPRS